MKTVLSSKPESTRNLVEAKEYPYFEEGIEKYKVGEQFSIKDVLIKGGYTVDGKLVSFERLIKNNIESGNLCGLKEIGKQADGCIYEKTCEVKVKDVFRAELIEDGDTFLNTNYKPVKSLPVKMFVFCSYTSKRSSKDIKFRVYIRIKDANGTTIFKKDYNITNQLGYCGSTKITKNNQTFPAIQSVWYGFDRAVELLKEGTLVNIGKIYFIGPNIQMMKRIAGQNLSTNKYAYAYTQYIQDNFFQFLPEQLRGIKIPYYLVACDKETLDKYMDTLLKEL